MAVKLVATFQRFQCLSSDEMPEAPEGSTVHIVDTGEEYVRYDGGWERDLRRIRAIQDAAM